MALSIHHDAVSGAPLPSATVMVLRDGSGGLQVLLMRRHAASGELGGVWVFPGGKFDAVDSELAWPGLDRAPIGWSASLAEPDLPPALARALYAAALRETHEECGLRLQAQQLLPWSRWITPRQPSVTRKRFDTRFFVAPAPHGQLAQHDNHEATELLWATPADALQRYWAGGFDLAPPQIMSLAELARLPDVAAVLALAERRPPPLIEPEPFDENGCRVICYPGDPRHPVRHPAWPGPTRLRFRRQRFEPDGGLAALLGTA